MTDDTLLPFDLPAVCRKKVTSAFDGGLISSDGGLVLLREAERRIDLAEILAGCLRDRRDPALVTHGLAGMLRFRMLAIACGYEDADDCDTLRHDPLFKLAVGRAPESGHELCSQPTMSRHIDGNEPRSPPVPYLRQRRRRQEHADRSSAIRFQALVR